MPIQENALNSALADALSEHDLHATPEQTHANTGSERCDVQVRRNYDDRLQPLPRIHEDPVRRALDDAVLTAVPGLPTGDLADWRRAIALEPSVNNEKDPFRLSEAYP